MRQTRLIFLFSALAMLGGCYTKTQSIVYDNYSAPKLPDQTNDGWFKLPGGVLYKGEFLNNQPHGAGVCKTEYTEYFFRPLRGIGTRARLEVAPCTFNLGLRNDRLHELQMISVQNSFKEANDEQQGRWDEYEAKRHAEHERAVQEAHASMSAWMLNQVQSAQNNLGNAQRELRIAEAQRLEQSQNRLAESNRRLQEAEQMRKGPVAEQKKRSDEVPSGVVSRAPTTRPDSSTSSAAKTEARGSAIPAANPSDSSQQIPTKDVKEVAPVATLLNNSFEDAFVSSKEKADAWCPKKQAEMRDAYQAMSKYKYADELVSMGSCICKPYVAAEDAMQQKTSYKCSLPYTIRTFGRNGSK